LIVLLFVEFVVLLLTTGVPGLEGEEGYGVGVGKSSGIVAPNYDK
jgi:hypothetical protein